jgi:hypothetical protein
MLINIPLIPPQKAEGERGLWTCQTVFWILRIISYIKVNKHSPDSAPKRGLWTCQTVFGFFTNRYF